MRHFAPRRIQPRAPAQSESLRAVIGRAGRQSPRNSRHTPVEGSWPSRVRCSLVEVSELYEAVYHSALNFSSLGYGDVVGDVTARGRNFPALMRSSEVPMPSNMNWTWPPIRS